MTAEELCEEIIRMITSGEVEQVSITGQTANDATLDPLTDAEEIIKAMGLMPLTTINQVETTNILSWSVQSIRTDSKEGMRDGNKNCYK